MELEFIALAGFALIAAVLAVTMRQLRPEYALLLSLCCGAFLVMQVIGAAGPAVAQLRSLLGATRLDTEYGEIVLKALGLSFVTQLAADTCKDAGENAIAAKVEMCGRIAIVILSLPLFEEILSLAGSMFSL